MRLTTITISGFKSFAQKTVIDVRKDITGIVGPNGSGKSNIAEAIRFVLGEQSMKSMRTSGGSDLIFKGSGGSTPLAALSRASVSLTLSNKDKMYGGDVSERIAPFLAYDEIVLAREIFADGGSDYTLNGAKVRLKDVEELLALAGIGNNKHSILSQGEADRVLLVSPKERKMLIEDALGLKVFQLRIDETLKKLEKTRIHLGEVRALEREIKPHFEYLKRQLEKIKKFSEEKERFKGFAKLFFREEMKRLQEARNYIREVGSADALTLLLETLEKDSKALLSRTEVEMNVSAHDAEIEKGRDEVMSLDGSLREKTLQVELMRQNLSRILKDMEEIGRGEVIFYTEDERLGFRSEIFTRVDGMKSAHEGEMQVSFFDEHEKAKLSVNQFLKSDNRKNEKLEVLKEEEKQKREDVERLAKEKEGLQSILAAAKERLSSLIREKETARDAFQKEEKKLYTMRTKAAELRGMISTQKEKERAYEDDKRYFESLLEEAVLFIGAEAKEYPYLLDETSAPYDRYEARKVLERSKLRLEEGGVTGAHEVESEYQKVSERLDYLRKEMGDIEESEKNLHVLIDEVRSHMKQKYEEGLSKVSVTFAHYFSTVFKGGEASLVEKEYTREGDDEEVTKELGVEISVKLPQKKVKSIAAFSGGEKALTAIALLFALAEVTPPPFIVLDETDAPLDEHNAKRYGETLALLSKKSKLLVITHNRETMSHCEMLYGVTIGTDGASKLLSVDLK